MGLKTISLRDFIIVKELNLELADGFTALTGETGAGKSELARALHEKLRAQTGRSGAFKSVNIAAVSPSLLEARLRGYLKGSFTDAKADQKGWFELANGGTLFLDEIQAVQARLRSPMVMRCMNDYLSGQRCPLELLKDLA